MPANLQEPPGSQVLSRLHSRLPTPRSFALLPQRLSHHRLNTLLRLQAFCLLEASGHSGSVIQPSHSIRCQTQPSQHDCSQRFQYSTTKSACAICARYEAGSCTLWSAHLAGEVPRPISGNRLHGRRCGAHLGCTGEVTGIKGRLRYRPNE